MDDINHNKQGHNPPNKKKLIGELLLEAALITESQLEVALADQSHCFKLKLGEILALRGWLKSQTADFLVEIENKKAAKIYKKEYPIGYYLKKAGLLNSEQIDAILQEQKHLGIKFCETAVLKGFLKEQTAEYLLKFLLVKDNKISHSFISKDTSSEATILLTDEEYITGTKKLRVKRIRKEKEEEENDQTLEDFYSAQTEMAIVDQEDIIVTPQEIIIISNSEAKCFYYNDIAYSPISIDL
ncbi:hypothetical protein Cyast_1953 [Cyanobacterium stanieri PCC 7202]|uniref:Uncharacterized protein n=1 Tax=Cyanobacterium stanieri (strain ATCC 29140 / PCC 7202) TaxID=292563 RepID=K9YLV1_CYASC|nr:hypothetical protein Cyast_1953 [Cyanobacterium stanieri PCC 7202]